MKHLCGIESCLSVNLGRLSPLRYLIRPGPLAYVPDEASVQSSSLKETYESSIDAAEDVQL